MSALDRFRAAAVVPGEVITPEIVERNLSRDGLHEIMNFAGHQYPLTGLNTLYGRGEYEEIGTGLPSYTRAVMQSPPAFGAQLVRSLVLSQARFQFQRYAKSNERYYTSPALNLVDNPCPKGTTGELISKMEWHEGLAGNAFVYRNDARRRLYVPRPDWVTIVHGSQMDAEYPQWQLDSDVLGYLYHPGGTGSSVKPWFILPENMAHWSPLPDPLSPERGMSWLTPVIREIESDTAATKHKVQYFVNGATPNLVVNGIPAKSPEEFKAWVDKIEEGHTGLANAYKTLYLTQGADATVVGANLKDLDYKALQGASETRISVASRVPAPVLGISEGLAGSSLNAGNYGQSRRNFADIWMYPTLTSLVAALAQIVDVPADSRLWHDTDDMPFLREDAKDAAEIESIKATTINVLVSAGYEPASVVAAVQAQNMDLLTHTGKLSVQLQSIDGDTNAETAAAARSVAEVVQKIYLGVANKVLTAEEARKIINQAGADLSGPGPQGAPS